MPSPKILLRAGIAIGVAVAAYLIYRGLSRYSLDEVVSAIGEIPLVNLTAATAFAAASYLCLTGFDYLGIRYAGRVLAYRRAALTSFTSLSIGHNIGVAALSSGAIRYRFYSRWGLSGEDVAHVILFSGATVALGLSTLAAAGLLLYPDDAEKLLGLSVGMVRGLAIICGLVPLLYMAAACFVHGNLRVWRWSFRLPRARLALGQIAVGTANFACVAACLHQLLTGLAPVPYFKVAAIYAIANATAIVSHVPGGLGVLEGTTVFLLPGATSIAALIAFRIIYFLVPLSIGLPMFLASEYLIQPDRKASANAAE